MFWCSSDAQPRKKKKLDEMKLEQHLYAYAGHNEMDSVYPGLFESVMSKSQSLTLSNPFPSTRNLTDMTPRER